MNLKGGNKLKSFGIFCLVCMSMATIFNSCDETYTPRPRGYFRIDLPEKKYSVYSSENCSYSFEIPSYAVVENYQDSVAEPCWKYIRYPQFNGEIFLSYRSMNNDPAKFIEDARTLAYKHTVKAESIDETIIETPNGVHAMIYDIGGNAASSVQFYATDSTRNFIRGALYFNVAPQPDSLAPVIQFLRKDVERMITSMKFGENKKGH
ncbi:MAG TPA: gliding motility lipoprotein GldD [Bacteroidia bacterium]|nr:gliding motility lipoprotein GldD [Bacteroidia bacterium]